MRMVAVAAVAAAVLLASARWQTPLTSRPPVAPGPPPGPPGGGVYEPGAPGSWAGVAEFTGATGVRPAIVVYYSPWNNPFAASFARTAWDHGAYVLVQLEPGGVPLASVAAGGSDGYLRGYADDVAAFGHPVILSFGHEMNGDWYSWGYGRTSPATFVAAWRHVVGIFRAAGAANVTWLWAVNSVNGASGALRQWWPGTAWVDWTGVDGYYFRPTDTFGSVFGQTIADIRAIRRGAPLLLAEPAGGPPPARERQIDALFAGVLAQRLAGVVWFDEAQHAGIYHQDWRLEDDVDACSAFSAAVTAYLQAPAQGAGGPRD